MCNPLYLAPELGGLGAGFADRVLRVQFLDHDPFSAAGNCPVQLFFQVKEGLALEQAEGLFPGECLEKFFSFAQGFVAQEPSLVIDNIENVDDRCNAFLPGERRGDEASTALGRELGVEQCPRGMIFFAAPAGPGSFAVQSGAFFSLLPQNSTLPFSRRST
ncbi:MAG: hypothetical protein V1789_02800 [PVC group bacterium]